MKWEVLLSSQNLRNRKQTCNACYELVASRGNESNDLNKESAEKNTNMLTDLSVRRAIGVVIVGGNNLQSFKGLYLEDIRKGKSAN